MWACDRASLSGVPSWLKGKASYRESSLSDWNAHRMPGVTDDLPSEKVTGQGWRRRLQGAWVHAYPSSRSTSPVLPAARYLVTSERWSHIGFCNVQLHPYLLIRVLHSHSEKYCSTCSVSRKFFINGYAWLFLLCFFLLWFSLESRFLHSFKVLLKWKRQWNLISASWKSTLFDF